MEYHNFAEILEEVKAMPQKRTMAIAAAADEPVIGSALHAWREGIVTPVFVGNADAIRHMITAENEDAEQFQIIEADSEEDAALKAVQMVAGGKADILMKGLLDTSKLLKPVVKKENGLNMGRPMTHFALYQLPGYHKLIVSTDNGVMIYPNLEDKKNIILNAASVLHAMGYETPKFAVLCAVEKVNPKMQETVDAAALKEMNQQGEISGCVVEGPLSYDVAMSSEIAKHKGVQCPYCGDFDVLVQPNLATGNIMGKSWGVTCGAPMAGIVVGAKCPIVLSSRGATEEEKYLSIALAALTAGSIDA